MAETKQHSRRRARQGSRATGVRGKAAVRRTQAERSSAMRRQLVAATIESLVDKGYTRTTTVEICERAGVTRGALVHHFSSPAQLFAEALKSLYRDLATPALPGRVPAAERPRALAAWVDRVWAAVGKPEFKAVIEIWLAARNDPEVRAEILEVVEDFKPIFSPEHDRSALRQAASSATEATFYRLVIETMIGMSLGRAVTPSNERGPVEAGVLTLLKKLASEI